MWQLEQASGCRASATEKVCRVWQASQEAWPKVEPAALSALISASLLMPILWQPPQPFWPSISSIGFMCVVGIAFMAAQARACLPLPYSAARSGWHAAQVSWVTVWTLATSAALLWPSPWQSAQPIDSRLWALRRQSSTMFGVILPWQPTQSGAACAATAAQTSAASAMPSRNAVERMAVPPG